MSRTSSPGKGNQVSTPERLADKAAFRDIVRGVGGLEAAEQLCRVGKTMLARYYDPNSAEHAPMDVVADLEPLARGREGWPHVTRRRARDMGFMLLERPEVTAPDCASLRGEMRQAMERTNQLHIAMMDALAGGAITAEQAASIAPMAMAAAEQDLRVHAILKRLAEEC